VKEFSARTWAATNPTTMSPTATTANLRTKLLTVISTPPPASFAAIPGRFPADGLKEHEDRRPGRRPPVVRPVAARCAHSPPSSYPGNA